jgi:hypothetical protein
MNPFNHFDKIFCVNLPDRKDRREKAEQEFSNMEIKVEFVDGIIYSGYKDKRRNACVGNHLAHAHCIQIARDNNAKNCLIFEDDIQFFLNKESTYSILDNAIKSLPDDWALFYLGINMDRFYAHITTPYLAKLDGGFSTHAYAINSFLFDKIIAGNLDIKVLHNDTWYTDEIIAYYKCFVTTPLLAGQRTDFSDIEGKIINSNDMFKERFKSNLI